MRGNNVFEREGDLSAKVNFNFHAKGVNLWRMRGSELFTQLWIINKVEGKAMAL